jgi:hypothetical protein
MAVERVRDSDFSYLQEFGFSDLIGGNSNCINPILVAVTAALFRKVQFVGHPKSVGAGSG